MGTRNLHPLRLVGDQARIATGAAGAPTRGHRRLIQALAVNRYETAKPRQISSVQCASIWRSKLHWEGRRRVLAALNEQSRG